MIIEFIVYIITAIALLFKTFRTYEKVALVATTRLSTKSQIVIPVSIRKLLDLNPGDMVEINAEDERIIIRKAHSSALKQLEECISDVWKGYDHELNTMREEWDT